MKLISNWKESWKFWSIRLGILGATISSVFLAAPDAAIYAWAFLPEDIKSHLPPEVIKFFGVGVLLLSFAARIVKQPKLESAHGQG